MVSIIENFKIFRYIPQEIKQNIKLFHVFQDNELAFCVLNNNNVYGLGEKIHKILGYTQSNDNNKYTIISELCGKQIEEFFGGNHSYFAKSANNQIYSWGWNEWAQVGRGLACEQYLPPGIIRVFNNINIVQLTCGASHCMALSSDGVIYGWGDNEYGQIVNRFDKYWPDEIDNVIRSPSKLIIINEKIKLIHCTSFDSYVVCCKNNLYKKHEFVWKPFDFKDCSINMMQQYKNEILDMAFFDDNILLKFSQGVYITDIKEQKLMKSDFNNFFEYFFFKYQSTYKTIHLENNKMYYKVNNEFQMIDELKHSKSLSSLNTFNDPLYILATEVKSFYISNSYGRTNKFFVKYDNTVWVFGENNRGKLGLGHANVVQEPTIVPELSNKNIEDFFESPYCMFARSRDNEIYSWGENNFCLLIRIPFDQIPLAQEFYKPGKIEFFSEREIVKITCGSTHCLAISRNGDIYGWGDNLEGQAGCEDFFGYWPENICRQLGPFKFIDCLQDNSGAVDVNGNAYFWGGINDTLNEDTSSPQLMNIKNVLKIQIINTGKCLVLTNLGKLYQYFFKENIKTKIKNNVVDICQNLIESEDSIFILQMDKLTMLDYFNFYDYFSNEDKSTQKTIHIKTDGNDKNEFKYLITKEINFNSNSNTNEILNLVEKNIFNGKYENQFSITKEIGKGSFGSVHEASDKITGSRFAIKFIKIKDDSNILREIRVMSQMKSEFIVKYIDSWVEAKMIFNKLTKYLFIKMELCSKNLRNVIENINDAFDDFIELRYLISMRLLKELTQCVDYLHTLTPPIMHRDLKPENILIFDIQNERLLKLCDFGLAKIHDSSSYSEMVGTWKYMAPEVRNGVQYNFKSDIYSLGIISTELFVKVDDFEKIRDPQYLKDSLDLNVKVINNFSEMVSTLSNCLLPENYNSRPDCKQILSQISQSNYVLPNDLFVFESILNIPKNETLKRIFNIIKLFK